MAAAPLSFAKPAAALGLLAVYLLALCFALSKRDATSFLTGFLLLDVLLPSDLVIKGMGAMGRPTSLVGLLALLWWAVSRMLPDQGSAPGTQPIRIAMAIFLVSILASYAAAFARPINGLEAIAANRGLFDVLARIGIALLAADGIHSRRRLDDLLKRLVLLTSVLAAVGIVQFATGFDITNIFAHLPGFEYNLPVGDFINQRAGFRRVQGTAATPIEFGQMLVIVLPIAVHYAMYDNGSRIRRWIKVVVIAAAIPMSLSRSAFLGVAVAGVFLLAGWSGRRRANAIFVTAVFGGLMRLAVPGLLGTVTSLFRNSATDPSVIHRQQDLARVGPLIHQYPFFGRGFDTFIPAEFFAGGPVASLDNQYLGSLVETGFVGLAALVVMLLIFLFTARGARRRSTDGPTRNLAQALAACAAVPLVTFYTYDAFGDAMITAALFLLIGVTGALWRLARSQEITLSAEFAQ